MQPLQPHSISTSRKIDFERTIRRTKKPPACAGGFVQFAKQILSADRYTGLQIRWTNNRQRRLRHDQFDPEGIPAPEIRRRARLAQCVHAGLFRSGGCVGETRQLKYDPCPLVHFGQTERDLLSFGLHQDLGAGTHSALVAGDLEVLAIAAQDDWLLGSSTAASTRSEEHTSELQSQSNLVCRLLLE